MAMSTAVSSAIARAIARLSQSRGHSGHFLSSVPTSAYGVGAFSAPAAHVTLGFQQIGHGHRSEAPLSGVDQSLIRVERPISASRHFADELIFSASTGSSAPAAAAWGPKMSPFVTQLEACANGIVRIASLHPGFLRALQAGDATAVREARRCAGVSAPGSSTSYSSWSRRQRQRSFKQRRLTALGGRFAWSMAVAGAIQVAQLGAESEAEAAQASVHGASHSFQGRTGASSNAGASSAAGMRSGLRFDQSQGSFQASLTSLLGGLASGFSGPHGPPALFRSEGNAVGGSGAGTTARPTGAVASAASAAGQAAAAAAGAAAGAGGSGSGNGSNLLAGLERVFADNHELAYQLGIGSVAGFCSGYAVKKVSKVVAFTVGVGFIAVQLAHYWGYAPPVSSHPRRITCRAISIVTVKRTCAHMLAFVASHPRSHPHLRA